MGKDLRRLMLLASCGLVFLYCSALLAHGTSSSRLEQLQHELAHHPNDASLYIARGRLYQERHNMHLAFEDYQRAAKLKPDWPATDYWLGLLYLEQEQYSLALAQLTRYVALTDAVKGYVGLAKLHAKQKHFRLSVNAWSQAISKDANASPAMYHQRAQALMKMETLPYSSVLLTEIVMGLEAGIIQHGPIASYLSLLVNVYDKNQQYFKALKALERLPSNLLMSPQWKVKKAQLLLLTGNKALASQVYNEALIAFNSLPSYKQKLTINQSVKRQVIQGLKTIHSDLF
ncbi:hypothetical protein [uncultured Shewanella sp.]|uniref:hypothetical protein n=1 Tax=uncultured Shewanella sp. TaxID=173975 RepID=UPI00262E97F0|nr:hypothetical protein [uncultured Shewanella sp.]